MHSSGERRANQSQVWAEVAEKAVVCGVRTDTSAMSDIYEQRAGDVEAYVHAFHAVPGQCGAVLGIDGTVVGFELFDSPPAFSRYLQKLIRSHALDAIETQNSEVGTPSEAAVRSFLGSIGAAATERFPALGEGEDIRLAGEGFAGAALAVHGRIVHFAGFAVT